MNDKPSEAKTAPAKEGISLTALAERMQVDPRHVRVWLRSEGKGVGRGGKRYVFTPAEAANVEAGFKEAQAGDATS